MSPLGRITTGLAVAALAVGGATSAQAAPPVVPPLTVTTVTDGLDVPWDVAFTPSGNMLYTQRDAKTVSLHVPGQADRVVLNSPAGMWSGGETGLMGIETAADFATSRIFYTCHGFRSGSTRDVRVSAWQLKTAGSQATFVRRIVTGLPTSSGRHGGCALQVGGSGSLYIGTGDAAVGTNPQRLTSGGGKVLRVKASNGAPYPGNPFISSSNAMQRKVFSYGHRNVQGLARRNGQTWSIEQGSYRDDEVNVITSRGNYGWNPVPRKPGDPSYNEGANSPMTDTSLPGAQRGAQWSSGTSTIATSGGAFLSGSQWGSLNGALAVSTLKGESLRIITFTSSNKLIGEAKPAELDGDYGRLRAAQFNPVDGALYVTTSNGSNDKILRITPAAG